MNHRDLSVLLMGNRDMRSVGAGDGTATLVVNGPSELRPARFKGKHQLLRRFVELFRSYFREVNSQTYRLRGSSASCDID